MDMDSRKVMAGQTTTANPNNFVDVGQRNGKAARQYAQGYAHGKQGRDILLSASHDYDAGYDAGLAAVSQSFDLTDTRLRFKMSYGPDGDVRLSRQA